MNINLQRKIDRFVGTVLCGLLSLLPEGRRDRFSDKDPENILVILLSEMGSLVLARPMFEYLKTRYPKSRIYVLVFKKNLEFLNVLDMVPGSNIFTVDGDSFMGLLSNSVKALIQMRRLGIDAVIDCELFARISSLFAYLSGAVIRVGFHPYHQEGLFRGTYINRPVLYNPYHHISRQFITLARAIDSHQIPTVKHPVDDLAIGIPPFPVEGHEVQSFKQRIERDFPGTLKRELVLIYPSGGLLPIRAWPLHYFCLVADELLKRGYGVGVIGMEEDKRLARAILGCLSHPNCIDLTGYTKTVYELFLLFHIASLLITNDGGPGHFAAMTPIKTIILYGPETPLLYGSLDRDAVQMYRGISCSPCLTAYNHRQSPCDGDNICLKGISPWKVLAAVDELLENE
jgi:ADP-heptose:LPS heptosyltransferase